MSGYTKAFVDKNLGYKFVVSDGINYKDLKKVLTDEFTNKYTTIDIDLYFHIEESGINTVYNDELYLKLKECANGFHMEPLKIISDNSYTRYMRGLASISNGMTFGFVLIPKERVNNLEEILEDIDRRLMDISDCENKVNFYKVDVYNGDTLYSSRNLHIKPEDDIIKVLEYEFRDCDSQINIEPIGLE